MEKKTVFCKICNIDTKLVADSFGRWHLDKFHKISTKEYYDSYVKKNKEGKCKICAQETKFISINHGYREYCSTACVASDDVNKIKIKKTKEEKYGNENFNNRKKAKKTVKFIYGVNNVSQIDSVKNKKKKTTKNNYGVDNPLKSEIVKKKIKQTCLNRYGVNNPSKSEFIKRKRESTTINKYGVKNFSQSLEYRKLKEELGEWIPLEQKSDFEIYRMLVWSETEKHKKELFSHWNGLCYYTGVKLITDVSKYNDPLYATIEHKNSISWGFRNGISPVEIGGLGNICICSREINSIKNLKTEKQFKKYLKKQKLCL